MEMHQIRYFLALCEAGSFTRAARCCGVTQPSLTKAIRQLEREIDGPLFVRSRTGATLTPLGAALREHFLRIEQSAAAIRMRAAAVPESQVIVQMPERKELAMSTRLWLFAAALGLLVGGGVLVGTSMHAGPSVSEPRPSAGVDPDALHRAIDTAALPDGTIDTLF